MNRSLFIEIIFNKFFNREFDITLYNDILIIHEYEYVELKIGINNKDLKISKKKVKSDSLIKYDLIIVWFEKTNYDFLNKIIKDNCKDSILICNFSSENIDNSILQNNSYLCEWSEYNKSLNNIFESNFKFLFLKKTDNPNIDSSLLIQSICNDNGDKYIMMGYQIKSMQYYFKKILLEIQESLNSKKHLSYIRFGDGDFYFLRNLNFGSAKIGSRSLIKKINKSDLKIIRDYFWKTKNICIERTYDSYNRIFFEVIFSYLDNSKILNFIIKILKKIKLYNFFRKVFIFLLTSNKLKFLGKKNFFYKLMNFLITKKLVEIKRLDLKNNFENLNFLPFECIYALVSTKWILKNYPKNIAVVGNIEKINLIKKLSKNQYYLDYLGIEKFVDFIEIPQKGAASDLDLSHKLKQRIKVSKADIFLLGVGSMKIYLLPLLKNINKIFIDVGCGIDALAGVVSQDRPYFSRWVNFQFENKSFDNIDLMDQNNPMRFAKKYPTVYIKDVN